MTAGSSEAVGAVGFCACKASGANRTNQTTSILPIDPPCENMTSFRERSVRCYLGYATNPSVTHCALTRPRTLIHRNQNFVEMRRVFAPGAQCLCRIIERDNQAHGLIDRELARLEVANDRAKIFRKSVSRAADIQFLLHEEPSLVVHGLFGVADIDHSAGKAHFLDRGAESCR